MKMDFSLMKIYKWPTSTFHVVTSSSVGGLGFPCTIVTEAKRAVLEEAGICKQPKEQLLTALSLWTLPTTPGCLPCCWPKEGSLRLGSWNSYSLTPLPQDDCLIVVKCT